MKLLLQMLGCLVFVSQIAVAESMDRAVSPIPIAELGDRASSLYRERDLQVCATEEGARLVCRPQQLQGEAGPRGLWLVSSNAAGLGDRFRVTAVAVGREESRTVIESRGAVQVEGKLVRWKRAGISEEYSVSVDGLRQDFLVHERPPGDAPLQVELEVHGARASEGVDGVMLSLEHTGRQVAYHRVRITDAVGAVLKGALSVNGESRLRVTVDDAGAAYPIRIDPTFSDANWVSMSGILGVNGPVYAVAVDSSAGVIIGGDFTMAGNTPARHLARWDGTTWSEVGGGVDVTVYALLSSGTNLFVGGQFSTAGNVPANNIARWDGRTWTPLGSGTDGVVTSLAQLGTAVYAGGYFFTAGGVSAWCIAKWDGQQWSSLGGGLDGGCWALCVMGSDLYALGGFEWAGGVFVNGIAKWNGSAWSPLGSGVGTQGSCLTSLNGVLYAGGLITSAGGVPVRNVARWNGSAWQAMGAGLGIRVYGLAALNGSVVALGTVNGASDGSPIQAVSAWDGAQWKSLGSGFSGGVFAGASVGTGLVVGGSFSAAGGVTAYSLARWDGSRWSAIVNEVNGPIYCVHRVPGAVYVGGDFTTIGGIAANRIARWNGVAWSALGTGVGGPVYSMASSETDLFVGGDFTSAGAVPATRVARWDGTQWSTVGAGADGAVRALAWGSTGLVAGGSFSLMGGVPAANLAVWNGTAWSQLGGGVSGAVRALVYAGDRLIVGGQFSRAGSQTVRNVASWDGSSWSPMAGGANDSVLALAAFGGRVYAGGLFTQAGSAAASRIAVWNGSDWSPLGVGVPSTVYGVVASGDDVFVTGEFVGGIRRWNGSTWDSMGSGLSAAGYAADIFDNRLYVAGPFNYAGTQISPWLAKLTLPDGYANVTGNGIPIPTHATTPTQADGTDFGPVPLLVGAATNTFSIQNLSADRSLLLDRSPAVTIEGPDAASFSVVTQPPASIPGTVPPSAVPFQIAFRPRAPRGYSATVLVWNSDPQRTPYRFVVSGTGAAPFASNQVVARYNLEATGWNVAGVPRTIRTSFCVTFVPDASDTPSWSSLDSILLQINQAIYTPEACQLAVRNSRVSGTNFSARIELGGDSNDSNPAAVVGDDFYIAFNDNEGVISNAEFRFSTGGPAISPTSLTIQRVAPTPIVRAKYQVVGSNFTPAGSPAGATVSGTFSIAGRYTGQTGPKGWIPSLVEGVSFTLDGYGFGTTDLGLEFRNVSLRLDGSFEARVELGGQKDALSLSGGPGGDFWLFFTDTRTGFGAKDFEVRPQSNLATTYVAGTVNLSRLPLDPTAGPSVRVTAADGSPVLNGMTPGDWGSVSTGDVSRRTYHLTGQGGQPARGVMAVMAGSAAGEFQVETQPASTLAGGQSTDLVVAFRPQAAGVRNAVLRVWTGDSLEGVFEIPVAGVGISPTMSVTGNGVVIPSGRTNATRSDYTDLGVSALAGAAVSRSFSIRNLSDSVPLRLSGAPAVVVEGPNADEFSVTQPATVDLAAQSTPAATTFKITFTPKGLGLRRATVRIQSNDAARNPYVFPIQGIGVLVNAPPASQLDHARVANGGSLNIPIAKLLANDADPEAVPLEFVDVVNPTRAGGTVSVSGTSIFYTAPAGFSGEDDFVYHLTDGALLVEGHADVTVDAPAPGTNLLGATVQSGVLQLSFAGIPGVPYRIQRCSSLVTPVAWVTVGTVVAGRNGAIDFNDTNPPSPAFYRTIAP